MSGATANLPPPLRAVPAFVTEAGEGVVGMELRGPWLGDRPLPGFSALQASFEKMPGPCWRFTPGPDFEWDSHCTTRLFLCARYCQTHGLTFDVSLLPDSLQKLLALASAVPPISTLAPVKESRQERITNWLASLGHSALNFLDFIGGLTLALLNLLRGRSKMRHRDFYIF